MSKEKRRVPRLRFPGFTGDWEQRKLGDLTPLRGGFAFKSTEFKATGVPVIRISNILSDGSIGGDFAYYLEQNNDENYVLPNNALVIAMSGATTGKAAVLKNTGNIKFYQNQRVGYFQNNLKCDYSFISTLVKSSIFLKQLESVLVAGAQPNISSKEIDSFIFKIPISIDEQRKISKLFNMIDSTIILHQRKLNHLILKKKSLLQKLFPKNGGRYPELRFPGFTDAWEQRKFCEIYERAGQKNDLTYGIDKIISVANMYFKKDVTVGSEEYLKTYNVFKLGDIAFEGHTNKEYRYGRFVENTIGDGIVSHIFDVFTPKINLDINFWKDLIKYEPIMGPILRRCTKASRMMSNLTTKEFLEEQILCPALEEQKLIGEFIVSLDKNITLHQRKLDHLQLQKKALLQQIFV